MRNKLTENLFKLLDEVMPMDWRLPTDIARIQNMSIDYGAQDKIHLIFKLTDSQPKDFFQICNGYRVDPTQIGETDFSDLTVMRVAVHPSITLTPGAFEFVSYSFSSVLSPEVEIPAGTTLATAPADVLKIAFIGAKSYDGAVKYLDPAVVIRILTVFNEAYAEILDKAVMHDWDSFFQLERFVSEYDASSPGSTRHLLLKEALRREYFAVKAMQADSADPDVVIIDPDMEKKYTDRVGRKLANKASRSAILSSYVTQVNGSPEKFASYFVEDMGLHLAVFREDAYDMDLVDRRNHGGFDNLAEESTGFKIIVNGPLFDAGECGLQPILQRGIEYGLAYLSEKSNIGTFKGMTKGTLYMRHKRFPGDCPIPDDQDVWRYYFAQRFNGAYEFKFGRLQAVAQVTNVGTNPDPDEISVAVEPLYGVFREGQRIGIGHEIDTDRSEPDSVFANKPPEQGIPIIGRLSRDGHAFIFVLMREDFTWEPDLSSDWEEIIQFIRDLGVVEAFITDGDDSVGLIIDDKVILSPGAKKNTLMPLAIGFIRRNA